MWYLQVERTYLWVGQPRWRIVNTKEFLPPSSVVDEKNFGSKLDSKFSNTKVGDSSDKHIYAQAC